MTASNLVKAGDDRAAWIDPAIIALDVADTAMMPGKNGGDGGKNPDCTKS